MKMISWVTMGASKFRTLKSGKVIDAAYVMLITGISSKATALKRMDSETQEQMLALKGERMGYSYSRKAMDIQKTKTQKEKKVEDNIQATRSAYDPMWQLIMKTI